jgi:hypothetical protein
MRAGAFAETRVIELINRRFVPYFYNVSGHGEGASTEAKAFVADKTDNPFAFLAAFTADGEYVGETELYADKDDVFAWLVELLDEHPECNAPSPGERRVLAFLEQPGSDQAARFEAARLLEALGEYGRTDAAYEELLSAGAPQLAARAMLGRMRLARHRGRWERHALLEQGLRSVFEGDELDGVRAALEVETAHRLLAQEDYAGARARLEPLTLELAHAAEAAELHFLAGQACWFLGDRDQAKFHWCWVVEQRPDDRLQRRAYIAAAAEAMPYANPELGGYAAPVGNIGTHDIVRGYLAAKRVYDRLLPAFERGELGASTPGAAPQEASPTLLVARLRDGNEHRVANDEVVLQLEALGAAAVASLCSAIEDAAFPGRGYAAWALSQVLKTSGLDDARARAVLEAAARDADPYVAALAESGLSTLGG